MRPLSLQLIVLLLLLLQSACGRAGFCENGDCTCEQGSSCEFSCDAPPCHVTCEGSNEECSGACANGRCDCGPGSTCDLTCASEPCHAECLDSSCVAECGNGDCTCKRGSTCDFDCTSGPCHVMCEGEHPSCNGVCANGSCTCGANSTCNFECKDANCAFLCETGAACLATCPGGKPGSQGCQFTECGSGEVVLCPDGITLACGADCPGK